MRKILHRPPHLWHCAALASSYPILCTVILTRRSQNLRRCLWPRLLFVIPEGNLLLPIPILCTAIRSRSVSRGDSSPKRRNGYPLKTARSVVGEIDRAAIRGESEISRKYSCWYGQQPTRFGRLRNLEVRKSAGRVCETVRVRHSENSVLIEEEKTNGRRTTRRNRSPQGMIRIGLKQRRIELENRIVARAETKMEDAFAVSASRTGEHPAATRDRIAS